MTGIGTNRTRFPARSRPSAPSNTPVPSVATRIAVTRVRKTRSELSPGIAATTFAPISAKIGATRSCGIAISAGSELASATIAPTSTALTSAITNPWREKGARGPSKISADREKAKRIVSSPVSRPAATDGRRRAMAPAAP